jgi:hypothetical protein
MYEQCGYSADEKGRITKVEREVEGVEVENIGSSSSRATRFIEESSRGFLILCYDLFSWPLSLSLRSS